MIATQNPHEQHGTYPLPEAQLDRFAMKLSVGYPRPEDEQQMLAAAVGGQADRERTLTGPLLAAGQLRAIQEQIAAVPVSPAVSEYLVRLAAATRNHRQLSLGASPRALLTWQRCAQSQAFLQGRGFVTPDDVQDVAEPVLLVRLGFDSDQPLTLIRELLDQVPVPAGS